MGRALPAGRPSNPTPPPALTSESETMKQMFPSLSELATTLQSNERAKRDFVMPATQIAMLESGSIFTPSFDPMPATDHGHRQIAAHLEIPQAYYDRMRADAPALLATNVNRWMSQRPADERRMVRTLNGNMRALLSDRYQRIDNYEVADVALGLLNKQDGLRIVSSAVTDSRLYIKAVSSAVALAVPGSRRVGDIVEAGVMVSNSEDGRGSLSIKPFAMFLVCTNGMVRDSSMRAAHVGRRIDLSLEGMLSEQTKRLEDAAVLSKVRDVIAAAFDAAAFERFIAGLGESTQQQITGDVPGAIEMLAPAFGLGSEERSGILSHLIRGGDLSRYGLANAITRTAEDIESYDRATELESIGFQLLQAPEASWKQIAEAKTIEQQLVARARRSSRAAATDAAIVG